nr:hypothetical protein [Mycolicibacterium pulveris]
MTRRDDDGAGQPWYNRTPAVLGASIAGLAVIGLLVFVVSAAAGQFGEPEQAPLHFVEPSYSTPTTPAATTTATTATVTTTSPPQTTDLSAIETTSTSETTSEPGTSSAEPTSEADDEDEEEDETTERTTRRPRTNVTRTLYPLP